MILLGRRLAYKFTKGQQLSDVIEGFRPDTAQRTLQTLDYAYTLRQHLQPGSPTGYRLRDRIQNFILSTRTTRHSIRIYQGLASLKLMNSQTRNIFAQRIIKDLPLIKSSAEFLELGYFLATTFPYHNVREELEQYTVRLHDIERVLEEGCGRTEAGYLSYSKVVVLLGVLGFGRGMPGFPEGLSIRKYNIKQCLCLLYNILSVQQPPPPLPPSSQPLTHTLPQLFFQADSVSYDKYLHRIEFIDMDQGKNISVDTFDIINWNEISMLARVACSLEEQHRWKVKAICDRKVQTQDMDFDTAVDVLGFSVEMLQGEKGLTERALQSVREMDEEEMRVVPVESMLRFLQMVASEGFDQGYFGRFEKFVMGSVVPWGDGLMERVREVYQGREKSREFQEFIANG